MKIWHLTLAVFVLAIAMTVARDEIGRVALVVFVTAIGEVVLGTSAILMLFRTLGSFGAARSFVAHLQALVATAGVLFFGGASMLAIMWFGASLLQVVVQ